jgi:hypothetical protein
MGRLSQASYDRLDAKRKALHEHLDAVVLDALVRLGNSFEGRTMDLRKHISEALKESQIKDTILRLVKANKVKISGNDNSRKRYEVL